jgi:ribosomal protein S18 acetylase RimI-like enzyme
MAGNIRIEIANSVTPELVDAFERLLPQLSSSPPQRVEEQLGHVVGSTTNRLLLAQDAVGDIVGTLTLVLFHIPTGLRAWIEDVVVNEGHRGRGVGSALIGEALRLAEISGARTVDLTARPSRRAANRLYMELGSTERETTVYRHSLGA